ncbi:LysM peptidoglycan-binding domain-containing protein [Rhodohalobacter halophilus]|uniref:LysM peptidoglycan-binding domain-containing protein n=1 Tax=Rhodohalobacter halophilus TaxID=1812810 RepID=UPI00083F8AD9|nr:LysM peptidoglycan-binding domain-containing protein [Rhodohalobacter halophilus]
MKQTVLLLITFFALHSLHAQAQTSGEIEIPSKLLPYSNPLTDTNRDKPVMEISAERSELDKEVLRRISDIYRIQVLAIDAQVQGDLVQAETYINRAFEGIQTLMTDYPEVQNNRRFAELYRTVMAEHSEFYGITEARRETEGDIFEVQEELFSEQDDWIAEGYALPDNLTINQTDVPLVQNQHVNRHLMYYTLRRPDVMERWLERSEYYFPMMKEIFAEEGVPQELIHLSMIESGLVPTARSWASAVGLWQFIRATGAVYGLEVNWWVDERRDPVKSTRAAAQHLRDLYDIWGDWHLSLANYNLSPRGLRRAIRAAGGVEDYWTAYPYLPRETRGYVPGYIAATMIAMNPGEFGFEVEPTGRTYQYDIVEVDGLMPLEDLAKAAGISLQEIKDYNPELLRWATPPGDKYPLKLPVGIQDEFIAAYQEIPKDSRASEVAMHTVSSGETLGYIARRYGTSVRALYETNEGLNSMIHPGQRIVVPVAPGSQEQIATNRPTNSSGSSSGQSQRQQVQAPANTTPVTYTVKSGDTVGHVAEWFDVRAWQVRSWNGISNTIRVGQRLTVHVPSQHADYFKQIDGLTYAQKQEVERRQRSGENIYALRFEGDTTTPSDEIRYTVRRNDTLGSIARRHGVSVSAIQRANNINGTTIYPGQSLIIRR